MRKVLALTCILIVAAPVAIAQEGQTLKERLSDKASDAQRIDNCHVPPERRGVLPRPDCAEKPRPRRPRPRLRADRTTASVRPAFRIERVDRRAAADEEAVPERPAKAQIGACFRQVDLAEQVPRGAVAAHAVLLRVSPAHAAPDIASDVARTPSVMPGAKPSAKTLPLVSFQSRCRSRIPGYSRGRRCECRCR